MRRGRGSQRVLPGIDVLLNEKIDLLHGARVGILAGAASVDATLRSVIDAVTGTPGLQVTALFGAEHGIRGDAQAGEPVATATDPATGIPVYSLYGKSRKPTAQMLHDVDLLLVDLFDVGCRYWTYLYTMAYLLQAA